MKTDKELYHDCIKRTVRLKDIQANLLYLIRQNCNLDIQRIANALVRGEEDV